MRLMRVVNTRFDSELGTQIAMGDRWFVRLRGMLGRPEPKPGEGLLLTPCRSVHMYGMRYPLDVAFLDPSGRVVAIYPSLGAGHRTRWHGNASHALELRSGTLESSGTTVGDVLIWSPTAGAAAAFMDTETAS